MSINYYGAGHTNGDSVVHFKHANIAHVGDLVFNRRHPFVDRSAGANIQSWINVLDLTLKNFDNKTVFVCGHSGENYDVKGPSPDWKGDGIERPLTAAYEELTNV